MNRRKLFGRAGQAMALLGGVGIFGFRPAQAAGDVRGRLLAALPSRAHAAAIGRVHLAGLDERPGEQALVHDITACMDMSGAELRQCSAMDLRSALKARTASDFAAGRTVRVGGWVLGMTEARLYSLAAIS